MCANSTTLTPSSGSTEPFGQAGKRGVAVDRLLGNRLRQVLGFVRHIAAPALAGMEGVSARRAHQLLAGAVVAETAMRRLGVESLDVCPWALREGVILRRLDQLEPAS